jgi:hypothetical protein
MNETIARRTLMTSFVVSPEPSGDAFVVNGLLSQFDPSEVVVAAERWPANPTDQTHLATGHRVHFVTTKWTWPKRGQRFVHWVRWALLPRTVARLTKIAKRERCEIVFANFPDAHLLMASYIVATRLRLALFPFFHNTYCENRRGAGRLLASWLQRRVFRRAGVVFVMSEGMKEEWQALYSGVQFEPLVHTFNGPVPPFRALPHIDRTRVRLGYLGLVSQANLDALQRIVQVVNESEDLHLAIYSGSPTWQLENQGLFGPRIRHEQPTDAQLQDALQSNDILLLPHGLTGGLASIEYRTIFPTRTIPYLLSGRPIVAYSAKGSFLSRWLRKHDCAEVVEDPDPAMLRAAIDGLCADSRRREQLARNALAAAENFRASRVVAEMKRIINQCQSQNQNPP